MPVSALHGQVTFSTRSASDRPARSRCILPTVRQFFSGLTNGLVGIAIIVGVLRSGADLERSVLIFPIGAWGFDSRCR